MGMFMGDDDMYIEGLLAALNMRFGFFPVAPDPPGDSLNAGERTMQINASGIREVKAIQDEFEVFKVGRPLVQSLRALGMGGLWNGPVKRKWFKLLNRLDALPSSDANLSGGQAIVAALVQHLQDQIPSPVHFKAHDARTQPGGARVLIVQNDRPVFYIERDFLTVSIPMQPRPVQAPAPNPTPAPSPTPSP